MQRRFNLFSIRVSRLSRHLVLLQPLRLAWWTDGMLLFLDLIMLFDLYEWSSNLLSPNTRRLRPAEVQILKTVYGNALPYSHIRIDERAHLGPRQKRFCYVSFHTINSWGPMHDALLIHEAMHVWQYVHYGALYIGEAVRAWSSEMGYNYGGGEYLRSHASISNFNFEQQADIMADAFRVMHGGRAYWSPDSSCLEDFEPYVTEVKNRSLPGYYSYSG
ncbi:MAG: hypothetical protein AAF741_04865 [Bacteroidota bacterium]